MSINLKASLFSGFVWTAFQTVGTKLISLAAQLTLAWLLIPEDFGKVGIASSITGIIFLIQNFGLSDVLISRSRAFNHLIDLAKSISLTTGTVCFILTFFSGFIAEYFYHDREIRNIILFFCFSIPFSAMSVVPDAKLRIDLKFKELSIIKVTEFLISQFSIIILVLIGFGVYSFVIGPLLGNVVRYFWLIYKSGISHMFVLTFHHWKFVFSNSMFGFLHSLFQSVIRQSDYLILGLFVTKAKVGIYFLAYSLSVQVIGFLVNSLSPVLFPSLMKIPPSETEKIKNVLIKITVIFACLGMPFAFWQSAIIEPLVLIFFPKKWHEMIQIVQILSFGIGLNVVSSLWAPALRIKGSFKAQSIYSFCLMLFFLSLMFSFSYYYGIEGASIAVFIYYFVSTPILLIFSFSSHGISCKIILVSIFKYFIISLAVFGIVYYLTLDVNLFISLFLNGFISPMIYFLILKYMDKSFNVFLDEIRFKSLRGKFK